MDSIHPLVQQLACTLLPGSYPNSAQVPPLYNAAYAYWKKTWDEFFVKAGSGPGALNIENFMRSRYVIVLHRELEVVGTLSASVFNSQADTTYDHPSIKPFPEFILKNLKSVDPGSCITGEYLSVHPSFRKDVVGLSLADVLVGLLLEILKSDDLWAMVATPVRAAKVAEITVKYGAEEIGSHLKIGVDCQMIYVTREMYRAHPDSRVMDTVRRLWGNREDLVNQRQ
ncbi:MAG: hypothetical protein AAB250_05400, partial [Bdellovibrionota bacterium]